MQGIKFYDPEIVGDTPETVELQGVRNLVQACKQSLGRAAGLQVFDAGGKVRHCQAGMLQGPSFIGTFNGTAVVVETHHVQS